MRVLESSQDMFQACKEAPRPMGLVPTMGALHEGHLALLRQARSENRTLAVSVFVNPAQFGPQEDLAAYPRDLEKDIGILIKEGTDLVFTPSVEDIYPPGFDTWIDVCSLSGKLEGAYRPGHFRGVATIVTKLFNIVRPDKAYFGQKDGQQVVVIRRLVSDLALGLDIVVVPTVRESDGLALSSRNVYLTPAQREAAPVLYRALRHAKELWEQGERNAGVLRQEATEVLQSEPLVDRIYYVSVADTSTLEELETVDEPAMMSLAVQLGAPRLIDNIILA